jgi:WD40 repeat protein
VSEPEGPGGGGLGGHLEAVAAGEAVINQAGRDLHLHLGTGERAVRRAGPGAAGECPYPGLAAFTAEQADWFFGRDRLTADLIGRLGDCVTEGGPLMVVAPSGAGKSSLLRAGLLAGLSRGALAAPGSSTWPQLVFTPGRHPLREAATHLAALTDCPVPLDPGPPELTSMLRQALGSPAAGVGRAVLVVDQFEQLFTLCADEDERAAFAGWLWDLAQPAGASGPLALVACGLRADFYAECAGYPRLRQALQAGQVLVGPMSPGELREAVLCPAQAAGLEVEPGLAEVLLRDLGAGDVEHAPGSRAAGRLPLLAHALRATWQQRHGSVLTLDGYATTGGIEHAVATTAERVYGRLDELGQQEARRVFLRLVKIGDRGDDVLRPASRPELLAGSDDPGVTASVLEACAGARLLSYDRDAVRLTHEALIRAWPRLRQWISQDRAGHLIRQDLDDAAAVWDRDGRDKSALYRGGRLEAATAWARDHGQELTPPARRFLSASRQLRRRDTARRRGAVAILAVFALLACAASAVAFQQRSAADGQRDDAIHSQIIDSAANVDPTLGALLLLAAYRQDPSQVLAARLVSTENTPLSTVLTQDGVGPVWSVAFSPHGDILAAGSRVGLVLWDLAGPGGPRRLGPLPHGSIVSDVTFSPDGRTLAGVDLETGAVQLWDVADPARPRALARAADSASSLAFSPDGTELAVGTSDGLQLWGVTRSGGLHHLAGKAAAHSAPVNSVAFSPDGTEVAVGTGATSTSTGGVQLWKAGGPARLRYLGQTPPGHSASVTSVAFSRDGAEVADGTTGGFQLWGVTGSGGLSYAGQALTTNGSSASSVAFGPGGTTVAEGTGDGTVWLWDIINPAQPVLLTQPLTGFDGEVTSVAFSPDGRALASASAGGNIRLWSIPPTILTDRLDLTSVAFSPDRPTLASGLGDGQIQLWDVADPARPRPLGPPLAVSGVTAVVQSVAFSPDGRTLASSLDNGTIQLWDVADPARPRPLGPPLITGLGFSGAVAFSRHGGLLAASGIESKTVRLWNVADPARPRPAGQVVTSNFVGAAFAFSPDGRTLATGPKVTLWDVASPARPRDLSQPFTIYAYASLAFGPDGRVLAGGSLNGPVQLWAVTDPTRPRDLGRPTDSGSAPGAITSSVAFSPNGHLLASGGENNTVQLWNTAQPADIIGLGPPFTTSAYYVPAVAFSSDSQVLASASLNGVIRLWNLNPAYAISRICATAASNLTPQIWRAEIPQLPYRSPCRK